VATQMIVPILGESIQEATLTRWLKAAGELVRRGEEIAEIETAKASLALECPANGVLLEICVAEGSLVGTGDLLAWIGQPGEKVSGGQSTPDQPAATDQPAIREQSAAKEQLLTDSHGSTQIKQDGVTAYNQADDGKEPAERQRRRVSPAARRMAGALGLDLEQIQAAAPGRRIMTEDVQRAYAALQQATALPAADMAPLTRRAMELSETRRLTGQRMLASAQQIPQFSVSMEADATRLLRIREALNQGRRSAAEHISVTALLVYLCGRALVKNPQFNATYEEGNAWLYANANIAVAVATRRGLVAPVIQRVEQLKLGEIARQLNQLVESARAGQLKLNQLQNATFTLSNLGTKRVSQFVPLVTPPQVAVLGVGAARPLILPVEGGTRFVQAMTLTVSADHRVVDGIDAAEFLEDLCQEIETFAEA
jgi:pyruvate dehydrogenase E2 component (dihydrolipoyllysine-residue acetyltransferase)